MLKRGDQGPAVVDVQNKLLGLGFSLPRWGADGDLGEETLVAMDSFLREHADQPDVDRETISDDELALLARIAAGEHIALPTTSDKFFDLREQSSRKNDKGPRPWSKITGITLHQTACLLAETPKRMLSVGAHIVTGQKGQFWWLHGFERLVEHGNGFNTRCVGIEMNGLFPGLKGNLKTVWDNPTTAKREMPNEVTDELVEVTVAACHFICNTVAFHGGKITHIVAHRQASASRQNDPGEEPWERVALRVMKELNLTSGPVGFKIGSGYPIPELWDARAKGIKY